MRLGWRGQAGRIRFQEIVVMTQSGAKMGKGLQESKGRIEEGLGGSLEKSLSSSPWASRRRCCKNFSWIRNLMSSCNPPRATISFLFVILQRLPVQVCGGGAMQIYCYLLND